MDRSVIRLLTLAMAVSLAPVPSVAHQLIVFASHDCSVVTIEAKFSNGKSALQGNVHVRDGGNGLQSTIPLSQDGTARFALKDVDHAGGLWIDVDTGSHNNYWIMTPEDLARGCGS